MDFDVKVLIATAFSVGMMHTLLGPDHYVPFVAMSKSNGWSTRKTLLITALCGVGHVAGSVVIGLIGLAMGTAIFQLEVLESFRGAGAAWLLIGFGLAYFTWGMVQAVRQVPHTHLHSHPEGITHSHLHQHDVEHSHAHDNHTHDRRTTDRTRPQAITPWLLFVIFVFGPCEVLIPLLMYPAADSNALAIVWVVAAFALATIGTMTATVALLILGLQFVRLPNLHRFGHASAGLTVLLCGMMVKFGL